MVELALALAGASVCVPSSASASASPTLARRSSPSPSLTPRWLCCALLLVLSPRTAKSSDVHAEDAGGWGSEGSSVLVAMSNHA